MESLNVDNLKEETVESLISIWKNQAIFTDKISSIAKGGVIILDWISACVEYRVKKLTLNDLKKREHDVIEHN